MGRTVSANKTSGKGRGGRIAFVCFLLVALGWLVAGSPGENRHRHLRAAETGDQLTEPSIADRFQEAFAQIYHDPEKARKKGKELIRGIREAEDSVFYYRTMINIGATYIVQSRYDKALEAFFSALPPAIAKGYRQEQGYIYNNVAVVYLSMQQHRDALDYFMRSHDTFYEIGDSVMVLRVLNNIGGVYLDANNPGKAFEYFERAYRGHLAQQVDHGFASLATHLGRYYAAMEQPDSALHFFDRALEQALGDEDNFSLRQVYLYKGTFHQDNGEYRTAIDYFYQSDSIAQVINAPVERGLPMVSLASAYSAMGENTKALAYALAADSITEQHDHRQLKFSVNKVFSEIYESKGDHRQSLAYHKKAYDELSTLVEAAGAYGLYQYEIDQLTQEMEVAELMVEKQNLQLAQRKNNMVFIIALSVTLIIILTFGYYMYINKISQRQREKLHQNTLRMSKDKKQAVLEAEVHERKRLGMELHDGVGPLISLSKLNISNILQDRSLDQDGQRTLLVKTAKGLDEVIKEMKYISQNLAPLVLMEKGLHYAIRDLVAKIRSLKRHKVTLNINGLKKPLDGYQEHAIYRTLQEIFNNIIKHSDAEEITVDIFQGAQDVTIIIEDNGVGFNPDDNAPGMGLNSAVSRIEGLDGVLQVDSKPGRGTIVTIIVPIQPDARGEEPSGNVAARPLRLPKKKDPSTEHQ